VRRHPRTHGPNLCGTLRSAGCLALLLGALPSLVADGPSPQAPVQPAPADDGDTYEAAKQLFDTFAPPEVKQQYEFPSREKFEAFSAALQAALDGDSFEELAKYEPQARDLLAVLRASPGSADYADWLAARLDELDVARIIAGTETAHAPLPKAIPAPGTTAPAMPYYDLWRRRFEHRPPPANAAALMPVLRAAFTEEGAPPELAWLAEVESSLNPNARNPSGARGLYQLKAATAKGLGLSTFLPDERTDPAKSAHAAARLLRTLKERFGSWPLAIAAYNAGEGKVSRALASQHASSFAGISSALPAGTRIYVPEVCALVAARTGMNLE
jgi:membrane-bound lytic murein transglycosylase D